MAKSSIMKKAALGAGVVWGLGVFGLGLMSAATGGTYGAAFITALGSIYLGYAGTPLGAIIGGILAFIDGAIAGAIFGYVYEKIR
ncbi:MAG: hypothetical protein KGH49_02435 [Candidatus Micrarchaeota archaeon]|nr:hypothetical protein [Candidatus Micrarchaeota archaeon]